MRNSIFPTIVRIFCLHQESLSVIVGQTLQSLCHVSAADGYPGNSNCDGTWIGSEDDNSYPRANCSEGVHVAMTDEKTDLDVKKSNRYNSLSAYWTLR